MRPENMIGQKVEGFFSRLFFFQCIQNILTLCISIYAWMYSTFCLNSSLAFLLFFSPSPFLEPVLHHVKKFQEHKRKKQNILLFLSGIKIYKLHGEEKNEEEEVVVGLYAKLINKKCSYFVDNVNWTVQNRGRWKKIYWSKCIRMELIRVQCIWVFTSLCYSLAYTQNKDKKRDKQIVYTVYI